MNASNQLPKAFGLLANAYYEKADEYLSMGDVQRVDVVFDIYSDEKQSIKSFEHTKRQKNIGTEVRILNDQTCTPAQFTKYLNNVQNKKNTRPSHHIDPIKPDSHI